MLLLVYFLRGTPKIDEIPGEIEKNATNPLDNKIKSDLQDKNKSSINKDDKPSTLEKPKKSLNEKPSEPISDKNKTLKKIDSPQTKEDKK